MDRYALQVYPIVLGSGVKLFGAVGRNSSQGAGLSMLDELPADAERLAAFHATRGDLLARAGRAQEASLAFGHAADLETDPAAATYLRNRAG